MLADDSAQIDLFEPRSIEAGEQNVEDKQEVDFARLEVFHPVFAFVLGAYVMQDQGCAFYFVFLLELGGISARLGYQGNC